MPVKTMRTMFHGELEKVYPYRTANVRSLFTIKAETEEDRKVLYKLLKQKLGDNMDNHIVFKLEDNPLYFWFTDWKIIVGTEVFTTF